ncbi:UNVERIFIED_CONTAM: hypothetical protein NCL1_44877 [Trichonephila clavipes]
MIAHLQFICFRFKFSAFLASTKICERITNEPIRGRWFATREDITNAVRQQVSRFPYGAANAEAGGIQHLPLRWQRAMIVAEDYIEDLYEGWDKRQVLKIPVLLENVTYTEERTRY